ncbi:hypothetical protein BDZ45DRAFT_676633 [Acephala macrosclerotiorum]|nr:hypothetical protein BDZ45DRAFT_676633 [Acephala macrosclerotiorum]
MASGSRPAFVLQLTTDPKPEIPLLSLVPFQKEIDPVFEPVLDSLLGFAKVSRAKKIRATICYLDNNTPKAILSLTKL